jgi:hypothetical protein
MQLLAAVGSGSATPNQVMRPKVALLTAGSIRSHRHLLDQEKFEV